MMKVKDNKRADRLYSLTKKLYRERKLTKEDYEYINYNIYIGAYSVAEKELALAI